MIKQIQRDVEKQIATADGFRSRITQLDRTGRLNDEVRLVLLGEIRACMEYGVISISQYRELEGQLGREFVKSRIDVLELVDLGAKEDEVIASAA